MPHETVKFNLSLFSGTIAFTGMEVRVFFRASIGGVGFKVKLETYTTYSVGL
jgi:hypothetical protein